MNTSTDEFILEQASYVERELGFRPVTLADWDRALTLLRQRVL